MLRFYTKFVVQRCTVCCDRRHLDKSTSDYIRNTGTQGLGSASAFWNRICVLKSHLRFEIASAFWSRICVLKSHLRFEIASAFWNRSCRSNAAAFSECDISSYLWTKSRADGNIHNQICCQQSGFHVFAWLVFYTHGLYPSWDSSWLKDVLYPPQQIFNTTCDLFDLSLVSFHKIFLVVPLVLFN